MKAKDSVMSEEQIMTAKIEAERLSWTHKVHPRLEEEKYLLGLQAEISFKAGIKEVVEWINAYATIEKDSLSLSWGCRVIDPQEWEDKLKDWGIECQ